MAYRVFVLAAVGAVDRLVELLTGLANGEPGMNRPDGGAADQEHRSNPKHCCGPGGVWERAGTGN